MVVPLSEESRAARLSSLVMAILLCIVGASAHYLPGLAGHGDEFVRGICLKLAMIMGIMWLAWPQMVRIRQMPGGKIFLGGAAILGLIFVLRPKSILALLPMVFAGSGILVTLFWLQRIFSPPSRRPKR